MNATSARTRSAGRGWIFILVVSIVSWFFLAPWFWVALTAVFVISYRFLGRRWADRDMLADRDVLSENQHRSPPNPRHLLWALPLGILVCAAMWYFEAGLYHYGEFYRASRAEIEDFYSGSVKNYIVSALIGSIPILAANWSRTLWPRLALTLALVAVQLITGSIFLLAPRSAL
ncbi:hypothetical protein [Lacisediminihabitans sp.]|uniref:hypothetical protein n=1 Tax=Lacisediminihabitans sp. TaxID=2787631 RepID=UPI002F940B81